MAFYLVSIASLYEVEIRVFHDMPTPVVYRPNTNSGNVIYLQCLSHIHYNPLYCRKAIKDISDGKLVNMVQNLYHKDDDKFDSNYEDVNLMNEILLKEVTKECQHCDLSPSINLSYNFHNLCSLIDSGAQVCLVSNDTWNKVKKGDEIVHDAEGTSILGLGNRSSNVVGWVNMKLKYSDDCVLSEFPFAIVRDSILPCCLLLGLNFLNKFVSNVNFSNNTISLNGRNCNMFCSQVLDVGAHLRLCNFSKLESNVLDDVNVKFNIPCEDLKAMQCSTHAIRLLRQKVTNKILPQLWRVRSLNQFKRHFHDLEIVDGLLVKRCGDISAVVVSFPFIIEIVDKVHRQLAHIGRHKMLHVLRGHFWHPSLDKISREICRACEYCQLNKVNLQRVVPPTLKLEAPFPFYMVAMDLMMFPRSHRGNVAVLVVIDHCSKWMTAVPLKDKTALRVCEALKERVFPSLLKVPLHVLSDNGVEFRSRETEQVLDDFSIKHIYTSPYTPSSNGIVERGNRSLKDILKGLQTSGSDWDILLPRALVIYNNTFHSQINSTPSEFLLKQVHLFDSHVNLDIDATKTWRKGHPNFSPFSINDKVIKIVHRSGKVVSDKFKEKYVGPFLVTKVQSNGLAYEVSSFDGGSVSKVHHKYLRPWRELPPYIKRYLPNFNITEDLQVESESSSSGGFVPFVCASSESSDSSSFSGFSSATFSSDVECVSIKFDDHRFPWKGQVTDSYRSNRSLAANDSPVVIPTVSNVSLAALHCSEAVPSSVLHSTPLNDSVNVKKYFSDCECLEIFPVMEQTLLAHDELASQCLHVLSDLSSLVDGSTIVHNKGLHSSELNLSSMDAPLEAAEISSSSKILVPEDTSDFSGFVSPTVATKGVSLLNDMRRLISDSRSCIQTGRHRAQNIRRELLERRLSLTRDSSTSCNYSSHLTLNEISDFVSELSPRFSTPKRFLRSHGSVPSFPNVQPSILEYKRYKL